VQWKCKILSAVISSFHLCFFSWQGVAGSSAFYATKWIQASVNVNGAPRSVFHPLEVLTLTKINLRLKIFSISESKSSLSRTNKAQIFFRFKLQQDGEEQENWEQSMLGDFLGQVKVRCCMVPTDWLPGQELWCRILPVLSTLCHIPAAAS